MIVNTINKSMTLPEAFELANSIDLFKKYGYLAEYCPGVWDIYCYESFRRIASASTIPEAIQIAVLNVRGEFIEPEPYGVQYNKYPIVKKKFWKKLINRVRC